jgi:hypothetical protein
LESGAYVALIIALSWIRRNSFKVAS